MTGVIAAARPQRTLLPLIAATVLAIVAGAAVGLALTRDSSDQAAARTTAEPGPRFGLASGVARIALPAGWRPLDRHSWLPGLREATAVRAIRSAVALDLRAPEDASLLPAAVVAAAGGRLPAPRVVGVGGRRAWRYDIPRPGTPFVALALPTTGGVVTIACMAEPGPPSGAVRECAQAMQGLSLRGAAGLAPAPATAARIVLPATIARLNQRRAEARRALAASRSPHARSAAARQLAAAYRASAERLRPLAAGPAAALTGALARLADRHLALAAASARRDPAAAGRDGAAIERDERALTPLLAAVGHAGTG